MSGWTHEEAAKRLVDEVLRTIGDDVRARQEAIAIGWLNTVAPGAFTLQKNMAALLKACADPAQCRGCGRPIWWMKTKNGKAAPYTDEGLNHFADCSAAAQFRKDKKP